MPTTISPFFLMSSSMSVEATRAETRTPTAQRPAFHNADAFITCSFARGKVADADGERPRLALHPEKMIALRRRCPGREAPPGSRRCRVVDGRVKVGRIPAGGRVEFLRTGRDRDDGVDPRLEDDVVTGFRRVGAGFYPAVGKHRHVHEEIDRLRDEDLAREIGFHRRAQIAGAAGMIALDARGAGAV